MNTISKGIEWVVVGASVAGVGILSLHRTRTAADRFARRNGGYVASTPIPRKPELALNVGDRCRIDNGMCLPADGE